MTTAGGINADVLHAVSIRAMGIDAGALNAVVVYAVVANAEVINAAVTFDVVVTAEYYIPITTTNGISATPATGEVGPVDPGVRHRLLPLCCTTVE